MTSLNLQVQKTEELSSLSPFSALQIRPLVGVSEARLALAHHTKVRQALPEAKKGFLQPKSESYFQALTQGIGGILFGSFQGPLLTGIVAVVECANLFAAKNKGVITAPNAEMLSNKYTSGPVGIVQSLCVNQKGREDKASAVLLERVSNYAQEKSFVHLFAQIAQTNESSWGRFLKQGYAIVGAWNAEHKRFLLHCEAPPKKDRLSFCPAALTTHQYL